MPTLDRERTERRLLRLKTTAPAQQTLPVTSLPPRPHLTPERQLTATPQTVGSDSGAASGSDSLGEGDIQIALTTYSPSPKPDISRLPRGAQGDVVVDVTIDPEGKVADLQILRALGYGVEGTVLDTVRTWTFRPATKDGVAIASVQELHFHFAAPA